MVPEELVEEAELEAAADAEEEEELRDRIAEMAAILNERSLRRF